MELANALRVVFTTGIEFKPDCFVPLAGAKLEAYLRKVGPLTGTMYEIVSVEPTVINRVGNEKIELELSIASEKDRGLLLAAVAFVYKTSDEILKDKKNVSFEERLQCLKPRLPHEITGDESL